MDDLTPEPGELDLIEKAPTDELRALQIERLRWSLRHAYENVDHYRQAFDAAGVRPDDCRELADLVKFPFTVKADLRDNYPFGMFAVPQDQVARIHASSGTTGKPTVVGYTAGDLAIWSSVMARSIRAAGGRRGHKVQLITDFEPDIIMVTPSYMLNIIDEMERQGVDPRRTSLKVGIFGAEPWTNDMRLEMEERLEMHAVDIYGLYEVMGPGVASECVETKDGLHIWEDHFYPEIIDPITGEVLPDGSDGELVFTSLTKQAMPVIRYRTRDLTKLLPGTARTMRRMEKITGRSDDMIILRRVNLFPTQIEELILRTPELSPHFQCVLTRDGRMDDLTVLVERREAASMAQATEAGIELRRFIKSNIGVTVAVDVVDPDTVERSVGKMRRIVDKRNARSPK